MEQIVAPLFHEVEIITSKEEVIAALRSIGRCFPEQREIVQVAHLLNKRGRHFLCHFKSLLHIDGVIPRDAVRGKDLSELYFAIAELERMAHINITAEFAPTEYSAPPSHVRNVGAEKWVKISKYTFKRPH